MKSLPSGLSVVVPAYHSAANLPELVARLAAVLPAVAAEYEVILVNDGSRDHTWEIIGTLVQAHPFVRGINLMRNYGQHNALLCGIRAARFDRIVTLDDDLQHPPEHLPALVAALTDRFDVVYAAPEAEQHGLLRNFASLVTKVALSNAMGTKTARLASAWRIFRTRLREAFGAYGSPYVAIDVLQTGRADLAYKPPPVLRREAWIPATHDDQVSRQSSVGDRSSGIRPGVPTMIGA